MPRQVWFAGLNGLRFFAAITVVLAHMHSNPGSVGLPQWPDFPILFKSHAGVSFFFVLSGFLITYLLLEERIQTGKISVLNFYLRRVFRIWPVYIIVIAFGLIFYWLIIPRIGMEFEIAYNLELAILLYTVLLANLMGSLYHVGGILDVTWSIAIEEQFYLAWAPLVKKIFLRRLPIIIISVITVSATVSILNALDIFGLSEAPKAFINTLQFHYLGLGAGAAWMLHYQRDLFLAWPVFATRVGQVICLTLILAYFFGYPPNSFELILGLPMGFLYVWLIVNTGANLNNAIKLPTRPAKIVGWALDRLGKVSYGIYMYHMIVIYFVSFLFTKVPLYEVSLTLYFVTYFALVMLAVVTVSLGSYAILEKRLIATGRSLNRVAPEDQISRSQGDLNRNRT